MSAATLGAWLVKASGGAASTRTHLRGGLVGHRGLATREVLRVPAGSNPSFVTPEELRVLLDLCPELSPTV